MSLTIEQQRAIALAKARKRKAEAEQGASLPAQDPAQSAPIETPQAPKTLEDEIMSLSGMKPLAELASAANKSVFQMLDFLGPNNVNAVMQLVGSDKRVPTLEGAFGDDGGYMAEGLARDAVRGLGQALPVMGGMTPVVGRNLASAKGITEEAVGLGAAKVIEPVKTATKAAVNVVSDQLPSKAKDAAKLPLYRQSGDIAAAGFKLDDAGRVVGDAVQRKALKAGIDEGTVAMISAANKPTKTRLKQMLETLESGKQNLEYRNFNPPQRVVGEAIGDRLRIIQAANKEAAGQLDSVAKGLEGQAIDVAPAIQSFMNDLANEGIKFKNGQLNFMDSSIEGLDGAQKIIKNLVRRLHKTNDPTVSALRVHNAKKFIDEQVTYGKTQSGLSGKMEGIAKRLRHGLDEILDKNFAEYDRVNTMYADTRAVIDEIQSLSGSKVDLTGVNVDKALGVMSRKALSNYNTGVATEDLFTMLDDVAAKYSSPLTGGISDDLKKIVSTEAELRRMFPTASKPNTLQGNMAMETARTTAAVAAGDSSSLLRKAGEKLGNMFTPDDEAKIKALKDLLAE